jgi:hypothetical protein
VVAEQRPEYLANLRLPGAFLATDHQGRAMLLFRALDNIGKPSEDPGEQVRIAAAYVVQKVRLEEGAVAGFRLDREAAPQIVIARHVAAR